MIALTVTWHTPSIDDAEISFNNFTVPDRVQTRHDGGAALYIESSLMPVRLQLDIEASPCIAMISCRVSSFPSQTTVLAVNTSPNSTSSDDLLVLQEIHHVATASGERLIVGDFNAPAVNWSTRTCPKSDGFDKNLLTTAEEEFLYQSITQPTHFWMGPGRQCLTSCSPNFPTQSQQSNYWHHWQIVITHYYSSYLAFMIHTSPHLRELNGVTMSE